MDEILIAGGLSGLFISVVVVVTILRRRARQRRYERRFFRRAPSANSTPNSVK
jgi:hypothetical protein